MPARSYTNVVFVLCLGLVPNGHGAAQSVSASQETLRIERLETLADVWGKLWLFHPNIVTSDVDWESILVRTIPEVERAQTIDQLLDVLNRSLFAPLGDPTLVAQKTFPFDNGDRSPLSERKLTGRVGYIDATDPREQKTKDFAQRFLSLVSELGDIETLVVDLRYRFAPAELQGERIYNLVNTRWLGLFTDRALPVGLYARRKHHGWPDGGPHSVYYESWEVGGSWNDRGYSGMPLTPIDGVAPLNRPTLILINNASYPILESALDALQTTGHVAVAWERGGPFVDWQRFQGRTILQYSGFRVWFMNAALVSRAGGLRLQPDFATESPIGEEQIVALARRVRSSEPGPRPPFSPQVAFRPRPPRLRASPPSAGSSACLGCSKSGPSSAISPRTLSWPTLNGQPNCGTGSLGWRKRALTNITMKSSWSLQAS